MERTKGCIRDDLEAWRTSTGAQVKEEAQTESTSSLFWSPGPARSKTDTQDVSGLHFWCSTHGWKDNFIMKLMALVWGPKSFWVIWKHRNKSVSRICFGAASPFLFLGPCIVVKPVRGACLGVVTTLRPLYTAATTLIRFWVLLRLFIQEQFRHFIGLWDPNSWD